MRTSATCVAKHVRKLYGHRYHTVAQLVPTLRVVQLDAHNELRTPVLVCCLQYLSCQTGLSDNKS